MGVTCLLVCRALRVADEQSDHSDRPALMWGGEATYRHMRTAKGPRLREMSPKDLAAGPVPPSTRWVSGVNLRAEPPRRNRSDLAVEHSFELCYVPAHKLSDPVKTAKRAGFE